MIGILQAVVTPAILAVAPPSSPAPQAEYDWTTQRTEVVGAQGDNTGPRTMSGTTRGTNCYSGTNSLIDDWMGD
jgi:hypothetical protein